MAYCLQVQQKQLLDQRHLVGTNGKMLAMLINKAAYKTLQRPSVTQQVGHSPKALCNAAGPHDNSAMHVYMHDVMHEGDSCVPGYQKPFQVVTVP